MTLPDTWLNVWDDEGLCYAASVHNEQSIDAAVTRLIDSADTRDTLLTLDLTDGRSWRVRASQIVSWAISTPESRRRAVEIDQWERDEDTRIRHELNIWEEAE